MTPAQQYLHRVETTSITSCSAAQLAALAESCRQLDALIAYTTASIAHRAESSKQSDKAAPDPDTLLANNGRTSNQNARKANRRGKALSQPEALARPSQRHGPPQRPNLIPLCWRHHHLVHEGRWRLMHSVTTPGHLYLTNPTGTVHAECRPTRLTDWQAAKKRSGPTGVRPTTRRRRNRATEREPTNN